ncbi:MAG: stress response translation initiation inhibitor YciH [archaeon]
MSICPKCGLPIEICACKEIQKEGAQLIIYIEEKKYKKPATIIEGVDETNIKEITKILKKKLACGGTFKNGKIELQGNHLSKIKEILKELNYDDNQIQIKQK